MEMFRTLDIRGLSFFKAFELASEEFRRVKKNGILELGFRRACEVSGLTPHQFGLTVPTNTIFIYHLCRDGRNFNLSILADAKILMIYRHFLH